MLAMRPASIISWSALGKGEGQWLVPSDVKGGISSIVGNRILSGSCLVSFANGSLYLWYGNVHPFHECQDTVLIFSTRDGGGAHHHDDGPHAHPIPALSLRILLVLVRSRLF
jgi:hypothetical protein